MGRMNAEVNSRSEQEKHNVDSNSRRAANAGSESEIIADKYERVSGENSPRSNFFWNGDTTVGGIVRHLIEVDVSQMAAKQKQIKLLQEELVENEARINENKGILEQIEKDNAA